MKAVFIVTNILILLLAALVAILVLAVDPRPAVPMGLALTPAESEEVQQLLIDNDPRLLLDQDEQTIVLSEPEVNALIAYFASNILAPEQVAGRARLRPGRATLEVSAAMPAFPFGDYLNVSAEFHAGEAPRLESLQVGAIRLPRAVLSPLAGALHPLVQNQHDYQLLVSLMATVDKVSFEQSAMTLVMNWREDRLNDIGERARQVFIDEEEKARLLAYHSRIALITETFPEGQRSAPLHGFLRPLFRLAGESSRRGADPVAENRALFISLAIYLNELELERLLGPAQEEAYPAPRPMKVLVERRTDLPQHIVSTAAIAASAGADIADILSIYKEVHDSRYRTGFSFSDLTANQVGTALGNLATASPEQARRMQELMSRATSESEYMPPVDRFDGITEQEFINQYEDRGSSNYQEKLREIQATIAERPLFRAFSTPLEFIQDSNEPVGAVLDRE